MPLAFENRSIRRDDPYLGINITAQIGVDILRPRPAYMGELLKYFEGHAGVLSLHLHAHSYARQARPDDYDILHRHCGRHGTLLEVVKDRYNGLQIAGGVAGKADGEINIITL